MPKVIGSVAKYPARISFAVYSTFIALGTVVLWLPLSRAAGRAPITLLEALFTATSATCVTGLSVRSTGNDFSFLGQLAILLMIQVGGIGTLAPERRGDMAKLGVRAMIGGLLASYITATIAGILI